MRAYLQLMRLPAVFTALADIVLGFLLNHTVDSLQTRTGTLALLLGASGGLYLAGMVFNDLFDRRLDAGERPERPIPSGRVSAGAALAIGVLLMAGGVSAAALVGRKSLMVAGALVVAILAYDGFLKRTPLGPVGMGACRFLNVMLGASAGGWDPRHWALAGALGVYIAGVTWFARNEAGKSGRASLAGAVGIIDLGLAGVAAHILHFRTGDDTWGTLTALAIIALVINRRLLLTLFNPEPAHVQAAVRMLLLSYVVIEATFIFYKTGDAIVATATLALLIPAMFLGRWIAMT